MIIDALLLINRMYKIINKAERIKNVFLKTLIIERECFIKLKKLILDGPKYLLPLIEGMEIKSFSTLVKAPENLFQVALSLIIFSPLEASNKDKIISNLKKINNLSFNFKQTISDKTENGNCIVQYPKKIFCKYNNANNKILVSNGRSLVVNVNNDNIYRYSIKRTPLNYILDKKFLIQEIKNLKARIVDDQFINYKIIIEDNEINIFFDKKNFNLIGWQTLDIYQNLNITFISSLKINQSIKKNTFILPSSN